MKPILVSACLLGAACKYSGGDNLCPKVAALAEDHYLVPVCPEQLGGLPTPRTPAERQGDRVIAKDGRDVTAAYLRGAQEALKLARLFGCDTAILKARSPSCGAGAIYDGTFTGTVVPGSGVTAALLEASGIRVITEEELDRLLQLN